MTNPTAAPGAAETPATRPETGAAPVDVAAPVQTTPARRDSDPTSGPSVATTGGPERLTLPTCGGPATLRVEIRDEASSTVAAAVMVCSGDLDGVLDAIQAAGRESETWAGVDPPGVCGLWVDGSAVPAATPSGMPGPLPAAAPVPVAGQMVAQPARVRMSRARVLRLISDLTAAVDRPALPAPESVRFLAGTETVVITCRTVAEAAGWADEVGAAATAVEQQTIVDGQQTHLYSACALWRGSRLVVTASVPLRAVGAAA
ncbi:hypothetical protein [Micromonospora inyonensis]|nr:hypothetical protein [Micromonospora inyonensis]